MLNAIADRTHASGRVLWSVTGFRLRLDSSTSVPPVRGLAGRLAGRDANDNDQLERQRVCICMQYGLWWNGARGDRSVVKNLNRTYAK